MGALAAMSVWWPMLRSMCARKTQLQGAPKGEWPSTRLKKKWRVSSREKEEKRLPSAMAYGIIYGMRIKIDKAGRIVLPKPVRERFHLHAGAELELEHRPEGLSLKPVERGPSMALEKGIWVHLGQLPRELDWDKLIDDEREGRIKDLAGV
jgi:AbrB family looped-hinge helix DNA binding protein